MPDLQNLLDQIDRLDQEATKGPWTTDSTPADFGVIWGAIEQIGGGFGERAMVSDIVEEHSDAEFIALARTALPQLAQLGRNLLEIRDNAQQQADDINGGDALDITKLSVLTEVVRSINRAIEHAMETNQ